MSDIIIKVPSPKGNGEIVNAVSLFTAEVSEEWSEFTLSDGAIIEVRAAIMGASRVDSVLDEHGNPTYMLNVIPVIGSYSQTQAGR